MDKIQYIKLIVLCQLLQMQYTDVVNLVAAYVIVKIWKILMAVTLQLININNDVSENIIREFKLCVM